MDLFKISILCLSVLSGYVRESSTQPHRKMIQTNPNEISSPECYCLPSSPQGKRISEHISSKSEKYERLVIYLYKDHNNNLTLYVPNKQKQRYLPDLTLEEGDKLESIKSGYGIDLYQIYLNFAASNTAIYSQSAGGSSVLTSIKLDFPPYSPELVDTSPQTAKFKPIHVKGDSPNQNHPNPASLPLEVIKKHISVENVILPSNLNVHASEPDMITLDKHELIADVQKSIITVEPSSPKQISDLSLITESEINGFDKDILITIPQTEQNANFISGSKVYKNKPTHIHLHQEGNELNEEVTSEDETYNLIIQNEYENKLDLPFNLLVKDVPINPYVENGKFIYLSDVANLDNFHIVLDSNLVQEDWVDISESPYSSLKLVNVNLPGHSDKQEIFSLVHGNSGHKMVFVVPSSELNVQIKFEQWFQGQIEKLRRSHYLLQTLKLEDIKILVLQVLQKNGVTVSNTGYLVDSKGNAFFTNKLQLIPIVIKSSLKSPQLSLGINCWRSSEVMYLEAVLVHLTIPPKILGIISLGGPPKDTTEQPCNSDGQRVNLSKEDRFKNFQEITDKLQIMHKPVGLNTLKWNSFGSLIKSVPIKSKTLLGTMKGTRRLNGDIPEYIFKGDESLVDVPYEDYEYEDSEEDYEELGIRIIGGQAATSSGTPVSSRG